ncbi:hypothetical protein [Streptomyces sp. NBC_00083]|uniref:hypothetical protein n=1 Tax=Streptomyces sp. NBC_00083 TaxID=2975647 RepID=UPI00225A1B60|nr:hypothetical protein [Streptomyces sp. NBC_00083]MCX5387519.1 hypothetical protein [Streptomyces sp. NBC_00083]
MKRVRTLVVVGCVLTAAVSAGCSGSGSGHASGPGTSVSAVRSRLSAPADSNPAGDIPDNQAFVVFRPAGGGFTLKVPEGWAQSAPGGTTVFTDKLNRIEIATAASITAPTARSVTVHSVPGLRHRVAHFSAPVASQVSRRGGSAVLLTYQGDSSPDAVTGKVVRDAYERYTFFRQGHEVDLTLSGPVHADNVDPWRLVTDSFAWR